MGSLNEIATGGPFNIDLALEAGDAKARIDGVIAEPAAGGKGIDLRFLAEGSDLSALSGLVGTELPPFAPWTASLSLADHAGNLQSNDIQLQLGKSDISGSLMFTQREGKVPLLEVKLHSSLLDFASLQDEQEKEKLAEPKRHWEKVFSAKPLSLSGLKALDAVVSYGADRLVVGKAVLTDLTADAHLTDGVLDIKPLKAGIGNTVAEGMLQLNAATKRPSLGIKITAKDLEMGQLLKATVDEDVLSGRGDLSIELKGQGRSVAAIMGNLNGYSRLLVAKGTLKTDAVDSLVGGLSTLVGTLVGETQDKAVMNCLASDFEIKKGVATSRALLVDTEYSTVVGEGNINLAEETLDLLIKPQSKEVTLSVAVPVKIGGTLANPSIGVEEAAAARKAVGVLAVVGGLAFPPAALLGLGEMGTGEDNPCLKVAQSD